MGRKAGQCLSQGFKRCCLFPFCASRICHKKGELSEVLAQSTCETLQQTWSPLRPEAKPRWPVAWSRTTLLTHRSVKGKQSCVVWHYSLWGWFMTKPCCSTGEIRQYDLCCFCMGISALLCTAPHPAKDFPSLGGWECQTLKLIGSQVKSNPPAYVLVRIKQVSYICYLVYCHIRINKEGCYILETHRKPQKNVHNYENSVSHRHIKGSQRDFCLFVLQ